MFDEEFGALTITNTNDDAIIEDGLDSCVYNFSIQEEDSYQFIFIDNNEFGNFIINGSDNEMVIDQNITLSGKVNDGYIYTFKRMTIYEE
ncbi:hypothetical protein [Aestuariibaculum suncheonense]|uniref:Uncharacterized protein n=1 Tax=Aestuariibaculum suncheonense TaxID=1028745 RepID=A0A8J6Q661_9FLAO|nr:hypothetical protein [Aestuariibaculum suncheonense]MBD0834949.1 hypothetical protein [Aestuariibaculum suncheonense]